MSCFVITRNSLGQGPGRRTTSGPELTEQQGLWVGEPTSVLRDSCCVFQGQEVSLRMKAEMR